MPMNSRKKQPHEQVAVIAERAPAVAVVNLAGENPGARLRWNADHKHRILSSRLSALGALASLSRLLVDRRTADTPGAVALLQASSVAVYGDTGGEVITDSPSFVPSLHDDLAERVHGGSGAAFRAETCVRLETETQRQFGLTTALRIGLVLGEPWLASVDRGWQSRAVNVRSRSPAQTPHPRCPSARNHRTDMKAGALPYFELASKLGASRMGDGRQYYPWIHAEDAGRAIAHAARNKLDGAIADMAPADPGTADAAAAAPSAKQSHDAVHVCAPRPCTNAELMSALGLVHGRVLSFLPLPRFMFGSGLVLCRRGDLFFFFFFFFFFFVVFPAGVLHITE